MAKAETSKGPTKRKRVEPKSQAEAVKRAIADETAREGGRDLNDYADATEKWENDK